MLDTKKLIVKMLNALKVDYVVEQGKSGMWTYRKWNSGIAECWGTLSTSIAITTQSPAYGGYRSGSVSTSNFPFTFSSTPNATATANTTMGYWVNNISPATTKLQFYLSAGTSMTAANRPVAFYVTGTWK